MPSPDDVRSKPYIVIARRRIRNLEKSHIWSTGANNLPDDLRLVLALRQPFNSFKAAREVLGHILGRDPKKIQFQSFKGSKTFFPNGVELSQITESKDQPVKAKGEVHEVYGGTYTV